MASNSDVAAPDYSYLDKVHTLMDGLQHWAHTCPDLPAFIFRSPDSLTRIPLTFRDLYQLGGRWAGVLRQRGIGRGRLVVNTLPNCPERAVLEAAIQLSGAASVNGMCQLKDASDLLATLRQSAATAVVIDPGVMPDAYTALLSYVTKPDADGAVTSESFPALKFIFLVRRRKNPDKDEVEEAEGDGDFLENLRRQTDREVYHNHDVAGDDICNVFTTSGTTGFSKLAIYTHDTLVNFMKKNKRPPYIEFNNAPLGWVGGQMSAMFMCGTTRVLCDNRAGIPSDPIDFIYRAIREEKAVTAIVLPSLVPDLAKKVQKEIPGERLLAAVLVSGQPVTRDLLQAAFGLSGMVILAYGCTEQPSGAVAVLNEVGDFQDFCCGKVSPDVELRVVDSEGRTVPANTPGGIQVKGKAGFSGYLNDPEATRAAFTEDGFFKSGDRGWQDANGQLYVEGRSSDAIMRGSYIFYPGWLEARIRRCPAVHDVTVVGVPDVTLGSELCACVILEPSENASIDDVKRYVEDDITASTDDATSPRPRHYVVFESFPLTESGKVKRAEVKKMAAQRLESQKTPV